MKNARLGWVFLGANTFLFLLRLAFRLWAYDRIPIGPEDAYGLADIIELLFWWWQMGLFCISGIVVAVMFFRGPAYPRKVAGLLLGSCVGFYLAYTPLFHWVSRLT